MSFETKALSREAFDLLYAAFEKTLVPDMLSEGAKALYRTLVSEGKLSGDAVTEAGLKALEPYRVKRAVIIAAGFGARLVPITLNTPKPLVRVKGKRIIDTLLDAIVAAGIEEIVIVRGYLGEQFDQLLYCYPNITFIENPLYNEANNISSILAAKSLLENAYVFEADLFLSNPRLVRRYEYTSSFLGIPVKTSADWCFTVKKGKILSQVSDGRAVAESLSEGVTLYQEVGISYWTAEDGRRIKDDVERVFASENGKNRYWDQVVFVDCAGEYDVEIRPCRADDIVEIDSYRELCAIDEQYRVEA